MTGYGRDCDFVKGFREDKGGVSRDHSDRKHKVPRLRSAAPLCARDDRGSRSRVERQGWEGSERSGHQLLATSHQPLASKSRPDTPCGRPRMNPSLTVGTRRDPLGISAWRSIAHRIEFSSRVPVHSVLVQKSVTTITNVAGRLSGLDARESFEDAQGGRRKKLAIDLPETFVSRSA